MHQPSSSSESGEPGLFPPWLSALLQSSSSSTEPGGEQKQPGQLPPALVDQLRSICTASSEPPSAGGGGIPILSVNAPSSICAASEITGFTKSRHVLHTSPSAIVEQSKRLAKIAMEHYNKMKKIKFDLVDVMPVIMMSEPEGLYTHVNFTAWSNKEGLSEKLFFAELQRCGKTRQVPSGQLVTCCEPLGSDSIVGHKGFEIDDTSRVVRNNVDFTCCFTCSPRMHHPKGHKYVAGHCNIRYNYDSTC
ncbi:hypothetical protein PR202_gb13007 [Eleusine coracana subsp. coracana]|uniref:DUF3615 domain-containing protein n=1 Tax=Eleusine coracana subsp. coracana TaxID=191504 RepID=A0AAV5ES12_ELECO|nr:hypothetical protein PR202_gb13007 [Eleusine coracana subsp. coracana]